MEKETKPKEYKLVKDYSVFSKGTVFTDNLRGGFYVNNHKEIEVSDNFIGEMQHHKVLTELEKSKELNANGLRKGQNIFNFLEWLCEVKGYQEQGMQRHLADPFHISDEDWDKLWDEFINQKL